jgi:hypothetical protein
MPLRLRATPQPYVRKSSKYGVRTDARGKRERTIDGIVFASKRECQRYLDLKLLEQAGQISGLAMQKKFELRIVNQHSNRIVGLGHYVCDFDYVTTNDNQWVIEDVKGFKTPLYRWKKKHFEAQYGLKIREV